MRQIVEREIASVTSQERWAIERRRTQLRETSLLTGWHATESGKGRVGWSKPKQGILHDGQATPRTGHAKRGSAVSQGATGTMSYPCLPSEEGEDGEEVGRGRGGTDSDAANGVGRLRSRAYPSGRLYASLESGEGNEESSVGWLGATAAPPREMQETPHATQLEGEWSCPPEYAQGPGFSFLVT